jgi:hypothetical protein
LIVHAESEYTSQFIVGVGVGDGDGGGVTVDDGDESGVRVGDGNGAVEEERVSGEDGGGGGVTVDDGDGGGVTVDDGDGEEDRKRAASEEDVFCVAVNAPNVVMVKIMPVNASAIIIGLEKFGFAIVLALP